MKMWYVITGGFRISWKMHTIFYSIFLQILKTPLVLKHVLSHVRKMISTHMCDMDTTSHTSYKHAHLIYFYLC